ncbi:MAG: hypothetical protein KIT33_09735 [Candidatus Kapabacteria bacterium]|nr:hypothetical protein [Ignavibacteriota bacterium]MCW5885238.1 hypothetical protein [Candidatus Kapabacteria bacterium]
MKNIKIIFFVLITSVLGLLASNSIIQNFSAESNGDSVTIRWTSTSEDGVRRFELERSTTSNNSFKRITHQLAKGTPSTYSYVDTEAFMKQDTYEGNDDLMTQKTYNYRLKIVYANNTFSYSDVALIKHQPSSIRRTWGMIKEMFR